MPNYDRLSILVSLVVLGLALTLLVRLPTRVIETYLLGSPVSFTLSSQLLIGLLLTVLTAIGTEYVLRAHPTFATAEPAVAYSFPLWILPALITLAGAFATPQLLAGGLLPWLIGLFVTATLLSAVVIAEYRTIDPDDAIYTGGRLFLNLVAYVAALFLFSAVYGAKLRSALSASVMVVLAMILALTLLRGGRRATGQAWSYALICAMLLGEATWAMNYWGVTGLAGGGLLTLFFYFLTGLSQQQLLGRFNRAVLVEFGVVGIAALALLWWQGALSW